MNAHIQRIKTYCVMSSNGNKVYSGFATGYEASKAWQGMNEPLKSQCQVMPELTVIGFNPHKPKPPKGMSF